MPELNLPPKKVGALLSLCCWLGNFDRDALQYGRSADRHWVVGVALLLFTVGIAEASLWWCFLKDFKVLNWWLPVAVAVFMSLVTVQVDRALNAADQRRAAGRHAVTDARSVWLRAKSLLAFGPILAFRLVLNVIFAQIATVGALQIVLSGAIDQQKYDDLSYAYAQIEILDPTVQTQLAAKYQIAPKQEAQRLARVKFDAEAKRIDDALRVAQCDQRRAEIHQQEEFDGRLHNELASTLPSGCPMLAADRPLPKKGIGDAHKQAVRDADDAKARVATLKIDLLNLDPRTEHPSLFAIDLQDARLTAEKAVQDYDNEVERIKHERRSLVQASDAARDPLLNLKALARYLARQNEGKDGALEDRVGLWLVALLEAVFMAIELLFVLVLTFLKPPLLSAEIVAARHDLETAAVRQWRAESLAELRRNNGMRWKIDDLLVPQAGE